MAKVCPRGGHSHVRKKKSYIVVLIGCCCLYGFIQLINIDERYKPLRPLSGAQNEADRLLKFITSYHYQCNVTFQLHNHSQWPICIDKDVGIDLESRDVKTFYSIGSLPHWDFALEKTLGQNFSFHVYLISHQELPTSIQESNNTHMINSVITPNDYADFSRNSYGQQTINDLMAFLGHNHLNLLRISKTAASVQAWELVHFMINDNLLMNVHEFQLAMYIDKLDEDLLYNWYRNLYKMFYKEGFRLYHTTSNDALCIQVTMMQSCIYYLSFVRIAQHRPVFVLHPPADSGTSELEEERLIAHINQPLESCQHQRQLGKWHVCSKSAYEMFPKPCTLVSFGLSNKIVDSLNGEKCTVIIYKPVMINSQPPSQYKVSIHSTESRKKSVMSNSKSPEQVYKMLSLQGPISLLEIDMLGNEWDIITNLLDNGLLVNVTQLAVAIQIPDVTYGLHAKVLRRHYSELKRLEAQGFKLFHSSPNYPRKTQNYISYKPKEGCCFKLVYIKMSMKH